MIVKPEIVLAPTLTGASAHYCLPRGQAHVEWRRSGLCSDNSSTKNGLKQFSLNVTVPVNAEAVVTVPLAACAAGIVTEGGVKIWPWRKGTILPGLIQAPTTDQLADGVQAVTVTVGSGRYEFASA